MANTQNLKDARDLLLKLHKVLVDTERAKREAVDGPMSSGAFLNLLLEDKGLSWLRRMSTLIVDIDEMFAKKTASLQTPSMSTLVSLRNCSAVRAGMMSLTVSIRTHCRIRPRSQACIQSFGACLTAKISTSPSAAAALLPVG